MWMGIPLGHHIVFISHSGRPSIPNPTLIVPSHLSLHNYDYTTMSNSPPPTYINPDRCIGEVRTQLRVVMTLKLTLRLLPCLKPPVVKLPLPPPLQSSWCSNTPSGFIHRPIDAWKRWVRNREWRRGCRCRCCRHSCNRHGAAI